MSDTNQTPHKHRHKAIRRLYDDPPEQATDPQRETLTPPPDPAGQTTPMSGSTPVGCPEASCSIKFHCDACLDEHLRTVHDTDYAAVYGDTPLAWVELCPGHAEYPLDRLPTRP